MYHRVLIKVVKLLGSLSPLEPRLAKKLTEPLCDIITTTPAKSLLYECVNTLLAGEIKSKSVIRLCLDKLRGFIEDPDQNLKYLGLLGLHKLMKKYPRVVSEHKDLILGCLEDDDVTIRMRALDLITSMVNQRNVQAIVRRMSEHLQQSEGVYREHVLSRILQIGAQDNYSYIVDFEWYGEQHGNTHEGVTPLSLFVRLWPDCAICLLCAVCPFCRGAGTLECWWT